MRLLSRPLTLLTLLSGLFLVSPTLNASKIKNIILMIGDGMGPQQMSLGELYLKYAPHSPNPGGSLAFFQAKNPPQVALSFTEPYGQLVVDSACSATQLATGQFSRPEMIGVDYQGNPVSTILEMAKKKGKSTGLVSDTRITHATPAAFAAHRAHRSMENEIAEDMFNNQLDVMLSGGYRYFLPLSANDQESTSFKKWRSRIPGQLKLSSKRKDERDLLSEAEKRGDQVVFSVSELQKIKKGKVLGLFHDNTLPDAMIMDELLKSPNRTIPTLEELAGKSLEVLSQNPKGFFLMVEGGQIDWGGHANDTGWMLKEILRFNQAVERVLKWAAKRQDTLVVVTADHETGSFGFSYSRLNVPAPLPLPGSAFKAKGLDFKVDNNFGDFNLLDQIAQQSRSLGGIAEEFQTKFPALDNPQALCSEVNKASAFSLELSECEKILKDVKEVKQSSRSLLFYRLYEEYSLEESLLSNMIGRTLSPKQSVVWATGTHTSTPVAVLSWGPAQARAKLSGILHHTKVGKALQELL